MQMEVFDLPSAYSDQLELSLHNYKGNGHFDMYSVLVKED